MAENKYTSAINEIRAGIKSILVEMEAADKKILQVAQNAAKIGTSFKNTTPDGLNNTLKEQTYLLKLLSEQISKQTTNTNKLNEARRQAVFLTGQEKINNRELAKNADLYAQSTSKLVGAYGNLIAKQKIAKKVLQDLISAEVQNVSQIKKAQAAYDGYTKKINQAKLATSNFSKNSLGGMVTGFKNLLGAFGVVGGAYLIADFSKKVFSLAKTLDSLNFTMRSTIKDSNELARTQAFLSEISEKYGQNVITLTNRFIKFRVAAEQSNVSFNDTIKIFEAFTKVSGVLGLKTDELQGIFLALEQMLSKGKVTTEELRRQLGERLPGAFGIAAQALEVTIAELDKMLKKGEVLSAETLPKLAVAVEEAFGLDTVNKIETLSAETERFSNSWTNLVAVITKSEGPIQKVMIGFAKLGVQTLDAWTWIFSSQETIFAKEFDSNRLQGYKDAFEEIEDAVKDTGKTEKQVVNERVKYQTEEVERLKNISDNLTYLNAHLLTQGLHVKENKEAYDRNSQSLKQNNKFLGNAIGALEAYNEVLNKNTDAVDEADTSGRTYQKVLDDIKSAKEDLLDSTKEEAGAILNTISKLEKEAEAWERANKGRKSSMEAMKGSIAYMEQSIRKLEELRDKTATTAHAYNGYTMAIDSLKEKLLELNSVFEIISQKDGKVKLELDVEEFNIDFTSMDIFSNMKDAIQESKDSVGDDVFGFDEMLEKTKSAVDQAAEYLKKQNISQYWADEAEFRKWDEIVKASFDTFSDYYDLDMGKFEFLYDQKENTLDQWMSAVNEVTDAALDASLDKYDRELEAAQRSRDLIVENEFATEKEIRIANEQFDEEERRIKTERDKAERKNTLIKIAIDTAAAIVKATAQTGTLAPFVIPSIIAIGAAQAAIVASQPLPEYAEGTKAPLAADTFAIVGDGGRSEAITENGKLVGVTPDTPTVMHLKKGQEVQKDANAWIDNAVYKMNMESNGDMFSGAMFDTIMHSEIRKMRSDTQKVWKEVKALAERPIFVNSKVVTTEKRTKYKQ